MRNPVSGLMEAIVAGDPFDKRFAADATVDTPLRGQQRFSDWAVDEHDWLIEGATTVRALNHIVTDTHASAEYVLGR